MHLHTHMYVKDYQDAYSISQIWGGLSMNAGKDNASDYLRGSE